MWETLAGESIKWQGFWQKQVAVQYVAQWQKVYHNKSPTEDRWKNPLCFWCENGKGKKKKTKLKKKET